MSVVCFRAGVLSLERLQLLNEQNPVLAIKLLRTCMWAAVSRLLKTGRGSKEMARLATDPHVHAQEVGKTMSGLG